MSNAQHDQNHVPTLTGISSTDGTTVIPVYVDATTHRLLVDLGVSTGTAAPTSTPSVIGEMYIDTSAKKAYVAMGTASSADWIILN
jgi:hypothetical protein